MVIYNKGIYPTMITPYKKDGTIDLENIKNLVNWYAEKCCGGIFSVCQSSEMAFLSLEEKVKIAEAVVKYSDGKMNVVASGHTENSIEEQIKEANEISKTGIDAFILVSNRFDIMHDGDETWLYNAEKFLDKFNPDMDLGIYECPMPYKRLLSDRILDWCIEKGRFKFIKDTCCDPELLKLRCKKLKNTDIMLFNANEQTFLHSLRLGAAGYSGIMANFHPDLLSWLYENHEKEPEKAEALSDALSMTAFTECLTYPSTAKHYLSYEGFNMEISSRSADSKNLTPYQKMVMEQLYRHTESLRKFILEV